MKSQQKYIALLVLVMLSTLRHSASVYLSICPTLFDTPVLNWAYAVGVVSVLDLVVIVFTIEGSKRLPVTYAVGLGILTGLYFLNVQLITDWVASTVFMVLVPLAGYEFAELFKQKRTADSEAIAESEAITVLRQQLADLQLMYETNRAAYDAIDERVMQRIEERYAELHQVSDKVDTLQETLASYLEEKLYDRLRKKIERTMQKGGEA